MRLHSVFEILQKFLDYVAIQKQNSTNLRIQQNTFCFFCRKLKQPSSRLFILFASHRYTFPSASYNYSL